MNESGPALSWEYVGRVIADHSNDSTRWVATTILGALGVFAVLYAVAVPIGAAGHVIAGGVSVLLAVAILFLHPWGPPRAETSLFISQHGLHRESQEAFEAQIDRDTITLVAVYQRGDSLRRRGYTQVVVHGLDGAPVAGWDMRWRWTAPTPSGIFTALGQAGYPATLRLALFNVHRRNSLAGAGPGAPTGEESLPVTHDSRAARHGRQRHVPVVSAARGFGLGAALTRNPVTRPRARVILITVGTLFFVGLAGGLGTLGIQELNTYRAQQQVTAHGAQVSGTIVGSRTSINSHRGTRYYDNYVTYAYTLGAGTPHAQRYTGTADLTTQDEQLVTAGDKITVLYDRSHPGTSYLSINPQSPAQIIVTLAFAVSLAALIMAALLRAHLRHRRYRQTATASLTTSNRSTHH
ncbi:MAG: DUF3592 domain-containing protein [Actinomycetota bacterium]|nr:DUF3592 domain-containing protein [Actinomycetota bacterium]